MPNDLSLDPYDPASWRRALAGLPRARCSLAPVWPAERLLQGSAEDLLTLRADSLARAARAEGSAVWIEVGADPLVLALLEAHGVRITRAPDAPLLAPWCGGNTPGVRSVQRLAVPPGRDAAWLLGAYLDWVDRLAGIRVRRATDQTRFEAAGLTALRFGPVESTGDRALMPVLGGHLCANHTGNPSTLELRLLPDGRQALMAIHGYQPSLPWTMYRLSQAPIHVRVAEGFARSLRA
jgi:hypothetical protein